jgi:peptidylprolyl isomerase
MRKILISLTLMTSTTFAAEPSAAPKPLTTAEIIASAKPEDWRRLDPADTLYVDLAGGRVVIELSRHYAPAHVAAIKAFAQAHYWDGLAINRVQDNFVVQWGDPDGVKPLPKDLKPIPPEFSRPVDKTLPFTAIPDVDGWAKQVGFTDGMAAARAKGQQWLAHCYGAIGVGRDNEPDSGHGNELYVVIGQSPRQLDGNVAVVGKVWRGMELLSSLPRGTEGGLGLYAKPEQRVPINVRLASEVPAAERTNLEVLREDRPVFAAFVEARRNRQDAWYLHKAGHIDVCNVSVPVREIGARP